MTTAARTNWPWSRSTGPPTRGVGSRRSAWRRRVRSAYRTEAVTALLAKRQAQVRLLGLPSRGPSSEDLLDGGLLDVGDEVAVTTPLLLRAVPDEVVDDPLIDAL